MTRGYTLDPARILNVRQTHGGRSTWKWHCMSTASSSPTETARVRTYVQSLPYFQTGCINRVQRKNVAIVEFMHARSQHRLPMHFRSFDRLYYSFTVCNCSWSRRFHRSRSDHEEPHETDTISLPVASLGWVTPGAATGGVTPLFFWKPDDLFCSSLSLSPSLFLLLSLGSHPLQGVTPHLFYLSDLVSPTFYVNLPTKIFSFGCHHPGGCHPGRSAPSPSDATANNVGGILYTGRLAVRYYCIRVQNKCSSSESEMWSVVRDNDLLVYNSGLRSLQNLTNCLCLSEYSFWKFHRKIHP